MNKQRIQVYADAQTKRRIELAAAKYDIPVTEYCLRAIEQQLADDGLLEAAAITIPVTPVLPAENANAKTFRIWPQYGGTTDPDARQIDATGLIIVA